jgi:hypothetical protein
MTYNAPLKSILQLIECYDRNRNVCTKTAIERQLVATDNQIDQLAHELYRLTGAKSESPREGRSENE